MNPAVGGGTRVGHANNVVALATVGNMLYCATADNRLWICPPVAANVNWTPIGPANQVLTMVGPTAPARRHCYARLWRRPASTAELAWETMGARPPGASHGSGRARRPPLGHDLEQPALAPTVTVRRVHEEMAAFP